MTGLAVVSCGRDVSNHFKELSCSGNESPSLVSLPSVVSIGLRKTKTAGNVQCHLCMVHAGYPQLHKQFRKCKVIQSLKLFLYLLTMGRQQITHYHAGVNYLCNCLTWNVCKRRPLPGYVGLLDLKMYFLLSIPKCRHLVGRCGAPLLFFHNPHECLFTHTKPGYFNPLLTDGKYITLVLAGVRHSL